MNDERRRFRTRAFAAVVLAAAIVAMLALVFAQSRDEAVIPTTTPTPTLSGGSVGSSATPSTTVSGRPTSAASPSPAAPSSATPATPSTVVAERVEGTTKETQATVPVLERVVVAGATSVATVRPTDQPAPDDAELRAVATGAMLEELQATEQEFSDNGWRQVGVPTIPWVKVGPIEGSGTKVTVEACIDSSSVKVIDESGRDVRSAEANKRSRNIFSMVREPGQDWKVESRGFPDQANC